MAELAPPATMKTPVRAGLRARPGPASQELFLRRKVLKLMVRSILSDGIPTGRAVKMSDTVGYRP